MKYIKLNAASSKGHRERKKIRKYVKENPKRALAFAFE
jgi:hypothetical protein